MPADERILPFDRFTFDEPPHMVHYPKRWNWETTIPQHYWTFAYFVNGVGELTCDGARYEVQTGKAYLFAPGSTIIAQSYAGATMGNFSLHICPKPFSRARSLATSTYHDVTIRNQQLMLELVHQCSFLASANAPAQQLLAKQYARTLLEQFIYDAHNKDRLPVDESLLRIAYDIKSQPGKDWSVDRIAQQLGLSKSQANLRFNEFHHQTPAQFVIDARIDKAKELLRTTTLQVQEVADSLGYRDVYFFSRQFKSKTGTTPKAFRSESAATAN